jgi:hypothetical protein
MTATELAHSEYIISTDPRTVKEALESLEAGDWHSYLFANFHRSVYAPILWQIQGEIEDDKVYWSLVGRAWVGCDNAFQHFCTWLLLFSSRRPHREVLMSEDERKTFDTLPEKLTIYRACNRYSKHGFSWTLDKAFAKHFAEKRHFFAFPKGVLKSVKPTVIEKVIDKGDAIAYFNRRKESEIVTCRFLKKGSL